MPLLLIAMMLSTTTAVLSTTDCATLKRGKCRNNPGCTWFKRKAKRSRKKKRGRCIPTPTEDDCIKLGNGKECRSNGCRWKKRDGSCTLKTTPSTNPTQNTGEIGNSAEDETEYQDPNYARYIGPVMQRLEDLNVTDMGAEEALTLCRAEFPDFIVVLCHEIFTDEDENECFLRDQNYHRIKLEYVDDNITNFSVG